MNNTSASAGMTGTRMLRKGLLRRDLGYEHGPAADMQERQHDILPTSGRSPRWGK